MFVSYMRVLCSLIAGALIVSFPVSFLRSSRTGAARWAIVVLKHNSMLASFLQQFQALVLTNLLVENQAFAGSMV